MAAESTESKVLCPICDHEVGTKDNGTKLKAHKVGGEKCDGSDERVVTHADGINGLGKGNSYERQDDAQEPNDEADDEKDSDALNDAEAGAQDVGSTVSNAPTDSTFSSTIEVVKPCLYLDDQAWHAENAKMVHNLARQAGHVPTQGEARHTGTDETEDRIILTYSVDVK